MVIKVLEGYKESPERRGLLAQLVDKEIKESQDNRVISLSIYCVPYKEHSIIAQLVNRY